MDAVADQEGVGLWTPSPTRRPWNSGAPSNLTTESTTTLRIDVDIDDCGLYHDNAPALHQVTVATTSSCLAVTPTSPMVSRSTKLPPFHPAACL
jgi:hypothetical protein